MFKSALQRHMMRAVALRSTLSTGIPQRILATTPGRFFSSCEQALVEEPVAWNAFDVLGLPERFSIDEKELKTNYRKLMGEYHPDRNRQAESAVDQHEKSSAVTQAYQELVAPHTRAAHLMALRGKPMTETLSQQAVGMEFLMEIMEIREEVENAADDQELRALLACNGQRMQQTCDALDEALENNDLDLALQQTARLQYWNRVIETIREKMDSFE